METIWNIPLVEITDVAKIEETRPAAVITGTRAWNAVGSLIKLPVVVQAEPYTADINFLDTLANGLPEQVEVVYGIGGGLACDVAKYVASKNGLPSVIVPTALSVDGFFTAIVAVRRNGTVEYEETGPAEKVYIDWDIVSSAPAHIRGTGITEILSMTTGLLDWRYAAERKKNSPQERYQPWAAQIAAGIAQQAYKIAKGVGTGNVDALRNLLDLICLEVQLTNQLGHNRPQEGSEQYFAYAIEPKASLGEGVPYSDLVGPGILIAAALHKQSIKPIRETLQSAGVRLGQLRPDDILETLRELPDYVVAHDLPFSIVHEMNLEDESTIARLEETGLDFKAEHPL